MTQYDEYHDSQKPAIEFLQKLGYKYISPENCNKQRSHILSEVLLEDVLYNKLKELNSFEYKNQNHKFSDFNIKSAINSFKSFADEGLYVTNEKIYDLLTLGKSFNETIKGDRKAFSLKYIDWQNPENNDFHITDEFVVEGIKKTRRPDIVLFVNGIPFVIIENKRRDKNQSLSEAISQHLRNQKKEEGIPRLFHYAQILLAVQPNESKYAVTGTPAKFWSVWKEDVEKKVHRLIKSKANGLKADDRLSTEQDKAFYSLCSPKRLLDIVYKYIVFDNPEKKICRYQQYFAVRETIKRVSKFDSDKKRKGGVIWHTTGSGKSLTMVMLSKALALEPGIEQPRVLVVTDRISLDKQIHGTFKKCGKLAKRASSGTNLIELLKDEGNEIITTIIDKFQTAIKKENFKDESRDLFVLVDESHRSQYGTANINMRRILPNATYIGFTGTPLLKSEKNTARKFGGFIHKYTIDQAVKDGAVVPLLYEGRSTKLSVNKKQIDKGFERLSENLNEEAQKDLKKKFASISKIYESEHVIEEIARDISEHYCKNWQGTGFKAQLAVPKIDAAIKYQKYFENQLNSKLKINTAVVFTPPDSRKSYDDVWSESSEESKNYWKALMNKYNDIGQEKYEKLVIDKFKDESDDIEMLVVVSKLLTGFDAPRNTVLYLAKPLYSHNLLQAIARVNRLFEGKDHGYIVDYVGILGKLDEALTDYSAFEDYDEEDLENAVTDISEEIKQIPAKHSEVWDIFKEVYNKEDNESLERYLSEKDLRDEYYERVSAFARALQIGLSSEQFYKDFNDDDIEFYKSELKRFQGLRQSVQMRYAEVISYKEYEPRVRKLLDTYVDADYVQQMSKEVDIFNKSQVADALETYWHTPASKADMIANRMKKVIHENMEKDEAFYKKFSEMIEETIEAFQKERLTEQEYLEKILKTRENLENGYQDGIPENIQTNEKARAFFGALSNVLENEHGKQKLDSIKNKLSKVSIDISEIVEKLSIRDWQRNLDVQRNMENQIEDYLIDNRSLIGIDLTFEEIDEILNKCLKVAKHNY